jgi:hypothetical protein
VNGAPTSQLLGDLKILAIALVTLAVLGGITLYDPTIVALLLGGLAAIYMTVLVHRRHALAGIIIFVACCMRIPLLSVTIGSPLHQFAQYADDGPLFLALVVSLLGLAKNPSPLPTAFWYGSALFTVAGLAGGVIFHANPPGFVDGTWLGIKFCVAVFIMTQLRWTPRWISVLVAVTFVIFLVQCAVMAAEIVNPTAVHADFNDSGTAGSRVGLTSLKGIFGQPVQAAAFSVFVTGLLVCGPVGKNLRLWTVLAVATAVVGLRVKTLVDLIIIAMMRAYRAKENSTRFLTPAIALGATAIVCSAGASLIVERFQEVLGDEGSARVLLYTKAFAIAGDHFPFGTGFGSYASEAASSHYSPVWAQYGMANVWGFRPDKMLFATDASIATVIGENGLIGVVGMALALGGLLVLAYRLSGRKFGPTWGMAAITYLLVVIAEGFASARLYDGFAGAALGALLAIAIQTTPGEDTRSEPADVAATPTSSPSRPAGRR